MRYLLGCVLLVLSAQFAYPQTPALSFTSSVTSGASTNSTRGYVFNVLSSSGINVSGLSFFDAGADGLNDAHEVGLWDSAGNLLASATVPSGVVAPLDSNGLFRVVNISSVFLAQGNNYRVGAVFVAASPDLLASTLTGASTPSELQYVGGAFINSVTPLTFPSGNQVSGLTGGSFEFAAVAVPEPATIAMLVLVSGGGAAVWYRRRQRQLQLADGKLKLRRKR